MAHCVPTFIGEFARTLTMVDMVTGWTLNASTRDTDIVPKPSDYEESTSSVPPRILGLAGLFIAAAAGVTFFLVGDLSETGPRNANYIWRPWPFLIEHEAAIGVVSMLVFVVSGTALIAKQRNGQMPLFVVAQAIVLTFFAAWLSFSYRVMTAGARGANIGGGLVLLVTPVFTLGAISLVTGLAIHGHRQRDRRSPRLTDI